MKKNSTKFEFVDEAISTIPIDSIQMSDRYRNDFGDIEDLAIDIKINGLINLPVITPTYQLIAGERRIRAMKFLGYTEVEVKIMDIRDEEHRLDLEIAENIMRKDFSKLERLKFAERLERIESIKAKERKSIGGQGGLEHRQNFVYVDQGKTTDIVAEKIGIGSGETYRKEKFIADNADPELTNSLSLRMMLGDGGSDYIAENFKNVEFTMLKLQFHGKLHLMNNANTKYYEATHCLFYDMVNDEYEVFELPE